MPKLAINGGDKVRKTVFPAYKTIGLEEENAVHEVLESGILSRFLGVWHDDFYGGPQVRAWKRNGLNIMVSSMRSLSIRLHQACIVPQVQQALALGMK
ncbi:hypothetical protein [Syntrophomonas palmitatica]|uniref:hypothetical protein n=1 Tax=Syntrophomonas palmitatica TaxID=402877 RepID=UPI000B29D74D|nr:hypothetical protein [Syntrophomonas palmitatica]